MATDTSYVSANGSTDVLIDGVRISSIRLDGIPIPDINTKSATMSYFIIKEDPGQIIVDKATYDKNVHDFSVSLSDELKWEFQGKICEYNIDTSNMLIESVEISLSGKFEYMRKSSNGTEIITKQF